MADTHIREEWLAPSLGDVLPPDRLLELRGEAAPGVTLWKWVVAEKLAPDEQIPTALSTRFRLKLADVRLIEPSVKEKVPEQLARRFHVLPLRVTDSYLEVATANPFDLDAEKALGFATEREERTLLLAPSKISEKLDELYRPEKAVDKLLQGLEVTPEPAKSSVQPAPEEFPISESEAR